MNRAQKIAWFNLIVILIGLGFMAALVVAEVFKLAVIFLFGAGILLGASPLLFWKKQGRVEFDERDQLIRMKAWFFASLQSYFLLILLLLQQVIHVGPKGSIPVSTLVGTIGGALACFVVTKSLWTLIEYKYGK